MVVAVQNDDHPLIGFSGPIDPSESLNGVDVRRAVLAAPVSVACQDATFAKRFYNWERVHMFQMKLADDMKLLTEENIAALDLEVPAAGGE